MVREADPGRPPEWERLFDALCRGDFKRLLHHTRATSPALAHYSEFWLNCVQQELQSEISEELLWVQNGRQNQGTEWTFRPVRPCEDGFGTVAVVQPCGKGSGEEGPTSVLPQSEDTGPRAMYELLLAPAMGWLFFVGSEAGGRTTGLHKCIQLSRDLRPNPGWDGGIGGGTTYACISVGSMLSYLYRTHALASAHVLDPGLRAALIPGCREELEDAGVDLHAMDEGLWAKNEVIMKAGHLKLNPGQEMALKGVRGPIVCVVGPPGTGKSSFIAETVLQRVPKGARVLAATATNKAIDSLVAKFEDAGMMEMLTVGSEERMGEASKRFLMTARLERDPYLAPNMRDLGLLRKDREVAQEMVERCKKEVKNPGSTAKKAGRGRGKKGKKGAGGGDENNNGNGMADTDDANGTQSGDVRNQPGPPPGLGKKGGRPPPPENNRGMVEGFLEKLETEMKGNEQKEIKRTPKVVRVCNNIGKNCEVKIFHGELYEAIKTWLARPPDQDEKDALVALDTARAKLREVTKKEHAALQAMDKEREGAGRRVWRTSRFVACTAASAVHVTRRLMRDMEGEGSDRMDPIKFEYVILDEAAALLEPDALGCLLHGAKAVLLVGDHNQLPPFTKWQGADATGYSISLMERMCKLKAGSKGNGLAPPPVFMLDEQYRMHPTISECVSRTFYSNKLVTAPQTAVARQHPMPLSFVESKGFEDRPRGATSFENQAEAEAVVAIVRQLVGHGGHTQDEINVLTFYNGQRALVATMLTQAGLSNVAAISVDAMQGREVDVVVLSCVRSDTRGLGFLADPRRINVGVSRARESFIVLGTNRCLKASREWSEWWKSVPRQFKDPHEFLRSYAQEVPAGWATLLRASQGAVRGGGRAVGPGPEGRGESDSAFHDDNHSGGTHNGSSSNLHRKDGGKPALGNGGGGSPMSPLAGGGSPGGSPGGSSGTNVAIGQVDEPADVDSWEDHVEVGQVEEPPEVDSWEDL